MLKRGAKAILDALIPSSCAACDAESAGEPLCASCRATLLPVERGEQDGTTQQSALFAYQGALAQAIRQAKFSPDAGRAHQLAHLFAKHAPPQEDTDLIVAIPGPKRRVLKRGFDLPALLASALARAQGLTQTEALRLLRSDPPHSEGADRAERRARVQGRFGAHGDVCGKRVLLIDDVITTGATLEEAARVLSEAGAQVRALALAKVL